MSLCSSSFISANSRFGESQRPSNNPFNSMRFDYPTFVSVGVSTQSDPFPAIGGNETQVERMDDNQFISMQYDYTTFKSVGVSTQTDPLPAIGENETRVERLNELMRRILNWLERMKRTCMFHMRTIFAIFAALLIGFLLGMFALWVISQQKNEISLNFIEQSRSQEVEITSRYSSSTTMRVTTIRELTIKTEEIDQSEMRSEDKDGIWNPL